MAAPSTDTVKTISNNLELSYQSLRRTALNIQALLNLGRATCDEVKAYNLWALAIYNTQRGMLTALRAAGEPNIPELPSYPTLFMWRGVTGAEAWKIDCNAAQQGLTGALRDAMQPVGPNTIFLSTQEVTTATQDQYTLPSGGPSLSTLVRMADGSLGVAFVVVAIWVAGAALAITAAAGLYALSNYWKEQSIQEGTTERLRIQAKAFDEYTSARLGCYQDCTGRGYSSDQCTGICGKLIDKPSLKIDPARPPVADTTIIGAGAVLAVAAVVGGVWWVRNRRRHDDGMVP